METIRSSETSGPTQRTTRRHIPEDDTLHKSDALHLLGARLVVTSVGFKDSGYICLVQV
jgi:hypothetical protein